MNNNSNFNSAITPEEIKRQISMMDVCRAYDIPITKGNICARWRNDLNASVSVNWEKGLWNDFGVGVGVGKGGDVISFVMAMEDCSFQQAIEKLLSMNFTPFFTAPIPHKVAESRIYIEEVKDLEWFPLRKYLLDRGLDERVFPLVKEIHYRNGDNKTIFKSIGFQQTDNDGWVLRSKGFKGCTKQGTTHLSFHRDNKLLVFEGFIDLLTYYMAYGKSVDYLCLNSTSNAHKVASALEKYKKIELWLDNDEAGTKATKMIQSLDGTKCMEDMRYKFYGFNDLNDFWLKGGVRNE